ncbi:MAG: hypothetical protein ACLFUB_05170 [Cyclobacteriaceae bacterium]
MKRRNFIKRSLGAGLALGTFPQLLKAGFSQDFPVHQITSGEKQHWFGYYDKEQVDPTGRYALGNEVDLIFRSPKPDDKLRIGLIDLENNNEWKEIGQSTAWGWQQGCMLQWIPRSTEEVIWNDREGDGFVSRVYNIKTGEIRTLPRPVYTLSPDGSFGLTVNFGRLQKMRPGYGYATTDKGKDWEKAPEDDGIYRVDLKTGESKLIISLAQLAALDRELGSVAENFHWCNHLLVSPSGNRFIFLNRSRDYLLDEQTRKTKNWNADYVTRAITCGTDGSDLYVLNDSGNFSHFIWKGDDAVTAWASTEDGGEAAFYEFYDQSKRYKKLDEEKMPQNGHNTYVPNTNYEWILNDTYPQGPDRMQTLYLYHVPSKKKVVLGRFHEPEKFSGEWRCDLHPRCDQQGNRVFFDSTHEGGKRQMYMVDIEAIVKQV